MSIENKILLIVNEYAENTGGLCGLPVTAISSRLGLPYQTVRKALAPLYRSGKIIVRKGKDGALIFSSSSSS